MLRLLSNFSQDSGIISISLSDVYEDEDGVYIRLYGTQTKSIEVGEDDDANAFLRVQSLLTPNDLDIYSEWPNTCTRRYRVKFCYSYNDEGGNKISELVYENSFGSQKEITVGGGESWDMSVLGSFRFNVGSKTSLRTNKRQDNLKLEYLDFYYQPIPQVQNYIHDQCITLKEVNQNVEIKLNIDNKFMYSDYLETGKYHYQLGGSWGMEEFSVNLEDIILSDANHVLKISYNPKISSFKTTIQEQKIDTIGGRFPFFVRNGNLKYKEFPIGGLLSFQMDDQFLFDPELAEEIDNIATTAQMFAVERKFKLAVWDWLMNGQPKLFRSPTEGNYIVRLMNVSLSPEDKLSRMLHSFSATAYEIDDYNYDNLIKHNLIYNILETYIDLSQEQRKNTACSWEEPIIPVREETACSWEEPIIPVRNFSPNNLQSTSGWISIEEE